MSYFGSQSAEDGIRYGIPLESAIHNYKEEEKRRGRHKSNKRKSSCDNNNTYPPLSFVSTLALAWKSWKDGNQWGTGERSFDHYPPDTKRRRGPGSKHFLSLVQILTTPERKYSTWYRTNNWYRIHTILEQTLSRGYHALVNSTNISWLVPCSHSASCTRACSVLSSSSPALYDSTSRNRLLFPPTKVNGRSTNCRPSVSVCRPQLQSYIE